MTVANAVHPRPEPFQDVFGSPDADPVALINLPSPRARAADADGSDAHLAGAEACARRGVEVARKIEDLGGPVRGAGMVTGLSVGEASARTPAEPPGNGGPGR